MMGMPTCSATSETNTVQPPWNDRFLWQGEPTSCCFPSPWFRIHLEQCSLKGESSFSTCPNSSSSKSSNFSRSKRWRGLQQEVDASVPHLYFPKPRRHVRTVPCRLLSHWCVCFVLVWAHWTEMFPDFLTSLISLPLCLSWCMRCILACESGQCGHCDHIKVFIPHFKALCEFGFQFTLKRC